MAYYRCKCGNSEAWGSDAPHACDRCSKCDSDLATHPDDHREPKPHEFEPTTVETDAGPATLSRCRYCHRPRAEIERRGNSVIEPNRNGSI